MKWSELADRFAKATIEA